MVKEHLKGKSTSIVIASDGRDAIALARSERPDLVILDVMMPGMTGWEVCKAIREDETLRRTGVLMLTGMGERLNDATSPLHGADGYLDKPFDFKDLDSQIKQILERRATAS